MSLTRRDFIKLAGLSAGAFAMRPFDRILSLPAQDFPKGNRLGRPTVTLDYRSAPRADYPPIGKKVYPDDVVVILREVVAQSPDRLSFNSQNWFETPDGYLYAGYVQPVRDLPNEPLKAKPAGKPGFWAEVTRPYVDLLIDNPPARSEWSKHPAAGGFPRLYYSQVVWIDQVKSENGQIFYRFDENGGRPNGVTGGGSGDVFWADGRAFRPLTPEDVSPISPKVDAADKKVVVDTTYQYQFLSCFEGKDQVYFCKCSTGYENSDDTQDLSTPLGEHTTWRKALSIHMSAGTALAGYDTPAVSWTNLFNGTGVAIHSAFWHNNFGTQVSHGCVNVTPEDAKWIFRWTNPTVTLDEADVTVGGTHVKIEKRGVSYDNY